jgi:hypothetical protein
LSPEQAETAIQSTATLRKRGEMKNALHISARARGASVVPARQRLPKKQQKIPTWPNDPADTTDWQS